MVPEPGITCLGMEYFCFKGDGLWSSADADLGGAGGVGARAARARAQSRRDRRQGRARAEGLSDLRQRLPRARRSAARVPRPDAESAHRRPQRHAQVQQPGSLDAHGDDGRGQHAGRIARHLERQHRLRVPRRTARRPSRKRHPRKVDVALRIGIDATCWANGRGYGRFTRELVRAPGARWRRTTSSSVFSMPARRNDSISHATTSDGKSFRRTSRRRWRRHPAAGVRRSTCCD